MVSDRVLLTLVFFLYRRLHMNKLILNQENLQQRANTTALEPMTLELLLHPLQRNAK